MEGVLGKCHKSIIFTPRNPNLGDQAVNKPAGITSAQVLRDLQKAFKTSAYFKPWFERERKLKEEELGRAKQKYRRNKISRAIQNLELKIGHGGTLDPLATGVLITGIGKGTKLLSRFLSCTKTYEAVLVFGAATDSYDRSGKILGTASAKHVTKSKIEAALEQFRGTIQQTPPTYSAIRMDGKRLYEYMREGKEIPKEIQARSVTVESLEVVEWWSEKQNDFDWPTLNDKESAEKVKTLEQTHSENMMVRKRKNPTEDDQPAAETESAEKKPRSGLPQRSSEDHDTSIITTQRTPVLENEIAESSPNLGIKAALVEGQVLLSTDENGRVQDSQKEEKLASAASIQAKGPAVRLRMSVSSGFYVRSLCHDLGKAVGSLGYMAELIRTRQGGYELGKNVLEIEELNENEASWSSKVKTLFSGDQQIIPDEAKEEP
ncbi:MAG: hypothetical protein M1814_005554 [Vezdaea aestivalis]|nr:MAG: hypothetical protein M1814_005554 [Vezdaea aestivalis]